MRFAICDDEPEHIKLLQAYFDKRPELFIDSEPYYSGEALVADYQNNGVRYDALFIDMEMGAMNGIDTANAIRALDDKVIIIYVTSHTRYMKKAFGHNVLDFVEKANLDTDLPHAIDTVARELARRRLSLSIDDNKKTVHLYECKLSMDGAKLVAVDLDGNRHVLNVEALLSKAKIRKSGRRLPLFSMQWAWYNGGSKGGGCR